MEVPDFRRVQIDPPQPPRGPSLLSLPLPLRPEMSIGRYLFYSLFFLVTLLAGAAVALWPQALIFIAIAAAAGFWFLWITPSLRIGEIVGKAEWWQLFWLMT